MATGKRTRSARKSVSTGSSTGGVSSASTTSNDDTTDSAVLRAAFDPTPFEEATGEESTGSASESADTPKVTFVGEQIVFKDRDARIAEAAYLRAQQRGFGPGYELDDWLAAEQEVDALLASGGNRNAP